jgi:putative ABC transport system ATP-binding protein
MTYRFEYLIPLPMKEVPTEGSSIWEAASFSFLQENSYLVEAPSGKGKTSLLSIMYGLRKDYAGKQFIDDRDSREIRSAEWSAMRKKQLSYIFQGLELFDDMSAWDNLMLKNNITRHKTQQQIRNMAGQLNIEQFLKKHCGILSFGQRQRVAIIRALCQPFNFLFADECFSHIDKKNSAVAMELIKEECNARGAGLILTSLGNNDHNVDISLSL